MRVINVLLTILLMIFVTVAVVGILSTGNFREFWNYFKACVTEMVNGFKVGWYRICQFFDRCVQEGQELDASYCRS